MFKKENNKYFAIGVTLLMVIIISVLFFVILTNIGTVLGVIKEFIDICASVIYGFAFAYIMNPIMMFTEKLVKKMFGKANMTERGLHRLCRAIGVTVAVIVFIAVVYGLIAMVVPRLIDSLSDLLSSSSLENIYDSANRTINKMAKGTKLEGWVRNHDPIKYALNWVSKELNWLDTLNVAFTEVYGWAKAIFNMLIGIVVAIYLLISKERFISQSKKLVVSMFKPKRANRVLEIARLTNQSLGGFFIGKIIDSLIIGIISYIGMLILDLPYPVIASVFVGLTNIIPFFGPLIGIVIGGVLILFESPIQALYFVIFELALQQVDGNIIGPRILGEKLGISDFWILVSITVFGGLFGFTGMLLGVPVFTVIYTLIAQAVNSSLKKNNQPLETDVYYRILTVEDLEIYKKEYQDTTVFFSGDTYEVEYDPDDDFEYELPEGTQFRK